MNANLESARRHSGRGNHKAAQAANARAIKAMAKKAKATVVDPLEIPSFLKRSKDPKVRAKEAAEWDRFLARKKADGTAQTVKVNWLKPRSLSEEEFAAFQAREEAKRQLKLENKKAKAAAKVNTVGKRWDPIKVAWIDEATGAVAPSAKEEFKAVKEKARAVGKELREKAKAEKQAKQAIPETGILAEFRCKPTTFRANLLVTFEKHLNKMLTADALCKAVYNASAKEKLGPLVMVLKGAKETITKLKLPYELRDKDGGAWGLFPVKAKGKGK